MPFREVDSGESRIRREMKRWLREIFIQDWNLKLLALAITLGLWLGVTGQRAPTTRHLRGVQLSFIEPNDMEISNDPPREVEVTVTGGKRDVDGLNPRDMVATVDVSDYKPGERVVQLMNRIRLELPQSVRIDDVEPGAVPVRLEPRVEREIEVEARFDGSLPEGYELHAVNITPDKVKVRGPLSHVNSLRKAVTETIRLDGLKENYAAPQTAIDISDPKVDLIDAFVGVTLEIGEQRVEKSFAGVQVQAADGAQAYPSTASVTLYGPRSLIEKTRPEELRIMLEAAPDGSITPRLVLPGGAEGRLELRSLKPSGFSIR
jgi:YbbR domain-containing protein